MIIDENSICIDTDFLLKFIAIRAFDDAKKFDILKRIFKILNKQPIMHPFVYSKELDGVRHDQKKYIFDDHIILVPSIEDIHKEEPAKKLYYEIIVKELYRSINGEDIDGEDVFAFWVRKKSLGEIHSLAMCTICTCEMFLSDDNDSKYLSKIIKEKFPIATVNVYNREEICNLLKEVDSAKLLTSKEIKIIKYKRQ